jgi:hypothetical protein
MASGKVEVGVGADDRGALPPSSSEVLVMFSARRVIFWPARRGREGHHAVSGLRTRLREGLRRPETMLTRARQAVCGISRANQMCVASSLA